MSKVYIGIDPGASGAIAFIFPDGTAMVHDFESPSALNSLFYVWAENQPLIKAVVEKVNSMPGQGVASSFKFGQNYGQWIGRLEALKIPYDLVHPSKWQKLIFDSRPRGDKSLSINRALSIFPRAIDLLKRKKDHNRADALLLAEYARITDR